MGGLNRSRGARVFGGLSTATIKWAYKFDALGGAMAILVTGAGFLIHMFSTGYMAEERNDGCYYRFMAYMNLFVFSMLNLVLGANILMMFLGWEGVGVCSYLLIGFYFDRDYAAIAGKKAFVFNRVGDFGFMIGFFLLIMLFGTVDYDTMDIRLVDPERGQLVAIYARDEDDEQEIFTFPIPCAASSRMRSSIRAPA